MCSLFRIYYFVCLQLRKDVASNISRMDTVERLKTFNARRKLKVSFVYIKMLNFYCYYDHLSGL